MKHYELSLNSINSVKRFVELASQESCEIDVLCGRYVVDAKSIMALFSIDLNRPVVVRYHGTDEGGAAFKKALQEFLVVAEI